MRYFISGYFVTAPFDYLFNRVVPSKKIRDLTYIQDRFSTHPVVRSRLIAT